MMTREERARQFMPFDAMKGLQEALRDREERHSRTERREISEELLEQNTRVMQRLKKGMTVTVLYYRAFHDVKRSGRVTDINNTYKYLKLEEEQIYFDDIYSITITDYPRKSI